MGKKIHLFLIRDQTDLDHCLSAVENVNSNALPFGDLMRFDRYVVASSDDALYLRWITFEANTSLSGYLQKQDVTYYAPFRKAGMVCGSSLCFLSCNEM